MENKIKTLEDTRKHIFYDVLEDELMKPVIKYGAHSRIESLGYMMYVVGVVAILIAMIASGITTIVVCRGNKVMITNISHMILLFIFTILAITIRHVFDKRLEDVMSSIRKGIYLYTEEVWDGEEARIREKWERKMRFYVRLFVKLLTSCWVQASLLLSLVKYFYSRDLNTYSGINQLLPYPFYMPFDTESAAGFWLAYLLVIIANFYIVVVVMDINGYYVTVVLTTVAELQVLNHSVRTIELRAYRLRQRARGLEVTSIEVPKSMFDDEAFQRYLYTCLLNNLRHHKAILAFKKLGDGYVGTVLGMLISVVGVILALSLYLLQEDPDKHTLFTCLSIFTAELLYTFYVCYFGQLVIEESKTLYLALYETPWFLWKNSYTKVLHIMMSCVIRPLNITCIGLNITASLQLYSDMISGMYKLVNVMRRS
uniref:Odorant receptor n=1 Tax=Yemma signatus TaxID=300820 RepID=A0A385H516_9HEMI|nr:odorant receptor [Yemma signatus]